MINEVWHSTTNRYPLLEVCPHRQPPSVWLEAMRHRFLLQILSTAYYNNCDKDFEAPRSQKSGFVGATQKNRTSGMGTRKTVARNTQNLFVTWILVSFAKLFCKTYQNQCNKQVLSDVAKVCRVPIPEVGCFVWLQQNLICGIGVFKNLCEIAKTSVKQKYFEQLRTTSINFGKCSGNVRPS